MEPGPRNKFWRKPGKQIVLRKQNKTQTLFSDTLIHPHLPSRSSVGLCCMILSMHFSCSRLIMQCSDSEATWERGIEVHCHKKGYTRRHPLTQIRKEEKQFLLQMRNKNFSAPLLPLFYLSRVSDNKIVKLWQEGVERLIFCALVCVRCFKDQSEFCYILLQFIAAKQSNPSAGKWHAFSLILATWLDFWDFMPKFLYLESLLSESISAEWNATGPIGFLWGEIGTSYNQGVRIRDAASLTVLSQVDNILS